MIGKYERCSSCPRLILAHKIKNKKKPLCEKCETAETYKFAPKKEVLAGMKPSVYIEEVLKASISNMIDKNSNESSDNLFIHLIYSE